MNLRSAKRLLQTRISLLGLTEIPFDAFLCRYLLEETAQKNIVDNCARHFSVFAKDHIHETALKNQQLGHLSTDVYWDVPLPQCSHRHVSEERKCEGEGLEHGIFQSVGGATVLSSITHVDDCVRMLVDESVSMCMSASQKGNEKWLNFVAHEAKTALQANHKEENSCSEGISEAVGADAETIYHKNNKQRKQTDSVTSELAEANFLSEQKEVNKRFYNRALELVKFNSFEVSCKDNNKEKGLDSSIWGHTLETAQTPKFLIEGKQAHTDDDSTSDSFVCDMKIKSQNHSAEVIRKNTFNVSVDSAETGSQRQDTRMPRVKDAPEICAKDKKPSLKNAEAGKCSDFCGFLKGVGAPEKVQSFMKEQGLVSWPHKRINYAISKMKKIKKKKKKKLIRQFGHEDLKHLSLSQRPFRIVASGQGSCKERLKTHGDSSKDSMQPNIISPLVHQEFSDYVYSNDSMSREGFKFKDKENGETVDAIFADRRQVNRGITNGFVEDNQTLFTSENSSKSRLYPDHKSGETSKHMESTQQSEEGDGKVCKKPSPEVEPVKCQDREHRTGKICKQGEKGYQKDANRPLVLVENEQAYLNALSCNEVIDGGSSSQTHLLRNWQSVDTTMKPHIGKRDEAENGAGDYFLGNKGKIIDYNQIKDCTSLDPPSDFWERVRTIAPVETAECAIERAKWGPAGVRKVHYPFRSYRDLYIILDLNGVLIKRWDKNPSLPGVCKLNKKWIQLRPGCIEFLQKAFSSFRVGIWSTMTPKNVLKMHNFLEQQAHQNLPFFMLWSKDSCYQHRGVQRPNKPNVVADFKPLSRVWGYFEPYLGFHNTVLVDDSPYKACMNNPYNCIFPDAFEGYTDDKYLNDVLWPYLKKMRMSCNIQAYIANNRLGQSPVVVGHELYHCVQQVMDVFNYCASPLKAD